MPKILFICHGNICRSPMAEFVMKDWTERLNIADKFEIASAATSSEEIRNGIGNPVYPPIKKLLAKDGIDCSEKRARQLTLKDYDYYDLLVAMDDFNVKNILKITGGDPLKKVKRLMDFTDTPGEVEDPWYTENFKGVYKDIQKGCEGVLLYYLRELNFDFLYENHILKPKNKGIK